MKILGTGSAMPAHVVTNDDLSTFLDTSDEWIATRTGIRDRRVLSGEERLFDLAVTAAKSALEDAGLTGEQLGAVIVSTVQGEDISPAMATTLLGELGGQAPSFDINSGCTGFLTALQLADALIMSHKAAYVLVVCAEAMSRLCDWQDRSTCVLFGDGAGAVVVGPGEGVKTIKLCSHPRREVLLAKSATGNSPFIAAQAPMVPLAMQGQAVYRFAVQNAVRDIQALLAEASVPLEAVDHFVLHQANLRILEAVRTRLGVDAEKFPHNIEHTGNTSSASIPLLLDAMHRQGTLKAGDTVVLSAFGAGLCTGAALLTW